MTFGPVSLNSFVAQTWRGRHDVQLVQQQLCQHVGVAVAVAVAVDVAVCLIHIHKFNVFFLRKAASRRAAEVVRPLRLPSSLPSLSLPLRRLCLPFAASRLADNVPLYFGCQFPFPFPCLVPLSPTPSPNPFSLPSCRCCSQAGEAKVQSTIELAWGNTFAINSKSDGSQVATDPLPLLPSSLLPSLSHSFSLSAALLYQRKQQTQQACTQVGQKCETERGKRERGRGREAARERERGSGKRAKNGQQK